MIGLDQIVSTLPIDGPNAVEVHIATTIDFANDTPKGRSLVGHVGHRLVPMGAFNRVVQKGLFGLCIPPVLRRKWYVAACGA